jgi:hypothetical protein
MAVFVLTKNGGFCVNIISHSIPSETKGKPSSKQKSHNAIYNAEEDPDHLLDKYYTPSIRGSGARKHKPTLSKIKLKQLKLSEVMIIDHDNVIDICHQCHMILVIIDHEAKAPK